MYFIFQFPRFVVKFSGLLIKYNTEFYFHFNWDTVLSSFCTRKSRRWQNVPSGTSSTGLSNGCVCVCVCVCLIEILIKLNFNSKVTTCCATVIVFVLQLTAEHGLYTVIIHYKHTHTIILWLCGLCPGQPGWAGTRRYILPSSGFSGAKWR